MKILIVEDDKHKYSDILKFIIKEGIEKNETHHTESAADTIAYLDKEIPSKIVLDMSLPSHKTKMGEGSAIPLPNGGIEVLLELRYNGLTELPIIILTQFPQIEINHHFFTLDKSADKIMETYGMKNISVCGYVSEDYSDENREWEIKLRDFLSK